jgi:urease alpha subunit
MKNKKAYIIFLCIFTLGNYATVKSIPTAKQLNPPQTHSAVALSSLSIISSISTVNRGGTGVIIIQGAPRTQYIIRTSYSIGSRTIPVMQIRTTDKTGVATFNWIVSMETNPGTYDVSISGEGNTLKTTHIVLP